MWVDKAKASCRNRKFEDETVAKWENWLHRGLGPGCSSAPGHKHLSFAHLWRAALQECGRDKVFKRRCRAAGGCFFFFFFIFLFFFFLDRVQIKMLEAPRQLFVSIFGFLAASDEERLDREKGRWIHESGILKSETSAVVLIHLLILANWRSLSSLTVFLSSQLKSIFCSHQQKGRKTWLWLDDESTQPRVTWSTLLIWGWIKHEADQEQSKFANL